MSPFNLPEMGNTIVVYLEHFKNIILVLYLYFDILNFLGRVVYMFVRKIYVPRGFSRNFEDNLSR